MSMSSVPIDAGPEPARARGLARQGVFAAGTGIAPGGVDELGVADADGAPPSRTADCRDRLRSGRQRGPAPPVRTPCRAGTRPCSTSTAPPASRLSARAMATSSCSTTLPRAARPMAGCTDLPLSATRRRSRRRDQLWRACLQHHPDLWRRAAILRRAAAGPVDPAVPAARRGRLRHDVPADLSCVAPVAGDERHRHHPVRPLRARDRPNEPGNPVLGLAAVAASLVVRRRDARPRRSRAYAVIRDPTCRLFGYHGLLRADGGLQPRPHVRILSAPAMPRKVAHRRQ